MDRIANRVANGWSRLRIFVQGHRPGLAQGLRAAVSALVTLVLAQWLELPLVLWAVLTAVIVTQTSVGRSLKAAIDYLIGTLGGAIYAGAVTTLIPHEGEAMLLIVLALAVAPLAFLATVNASFNVAPFTGIIVVLAPALTHSSPIESAYYRVIEVAVGAITGLVVSFAVFPAPAHALVTESAARMLDLIARVLPDIFAGLTGSVDADVNARIQQSIGEAVARLDAVHGEARRERMTHLATEPDPGPLLRTLLRLRHDLIIVGRAAAVPLPPSVQPRLAGPLAHVVEAAADFTRGCATALVERTGPPPRVRTDAAFDLYAGEIAALRREERLRVLRSDALERIFALGFALEQMRQHFGDLERCALEIARLPIPATNAE